MSDQEYSKPTETPEAGGASAKKPVEGTIDDASNKVQSAIGQAADQATAAVSELGQRAKDAYGRAAETTRQAADVVDPFVRERPYVALGVAALIGLVAGLLLGGNGAKVIYVRPARP